MTRAAALCVIAVVACTGSPIPTPIPTPAPSPTPIPTPTILAPIIPDATTQLITGVIDDWTATSATLQLWHRDDAHHVWQSVGAAWPAVIGKTGAAWGVGLHGAGSPTQDGPIKREGDGRSPAGAFTLRGAYGYASAPPTGTALPYITLDARWQCVDDATSSHYDQILDRSTVAVDWTSAENMRRPDVLYTWVIDVAHNPERTAGAGSCIFLHVWRNPSGATVGCTAMAQPALEHLLGALDPGAQPVYVLLPRASYRALATAWRLPPLA